MLQVLDVEAHAVVEIDVAPSAHLPEAGDSREDLETLRVPQIVGVRAERSRSRPYETHVAPQHVQDLRHLVEAGLAQEGAEPRDAGIVRDLEIGPRQAVYARELRLELRGVHDHGAELDHPQSPPPPP